ncbi:MAG: ABC transporter ATP-binding protein, partial [Eubacteriales bacterium]|nr:ABC transporter ATP-binding protein [Eubacteriales bacterium]
MIKLMKYLKKSAGFIVLIIALLFLQAYGDLSLPDYTSKIINVGVQQRGIEDGVPEKIRKSTMEQLTMFMEEETGERVLSFYTEEGENLVLQKGISETEREELNENLQFPMLILTMLSGESEQGNKILEGMGVSDASQALTMLSAMPKEAILTMVEQMKE